MSTSPHHGAARLDEIDGLAGSSSRSADERPSGAAAALLRTRITDLRERLPCGVPTAHSRAGDPRSGEADKAIAYSIGQYFKHEGDAITLDRLATDIDGLASDALAKVDAFRTMVGEGSFKVAFQPIVDLANREPQHYEALVRFDIDAFDVPPYEFITFAEAIGLIHEFDLAMCEKVLQLLEEWQSRGRLTPIAVNLSADSLATPSFASSLQALLSTYAGVRGRLMFEITETVQISDLQSVNDLIQQLRQQGHRVCLDDFGAGSAAFQYLRALEVDVVKIDGGFVRNAYATVKGKNFLKAMAGLLRELGITIIAEMVEDEKHLPMIQDSGITYGQGYLFGRPSLDIDSFGADDGPSPGAPGALTAP